MFADLEVFSKLFCAKFLNFLKFYYNKGENSKPLPIKDHWFLIADFVSADSGLQNIGLKKL